MHYLDQLRKFSRRNAGQLLIVVTIIALFLDLSLVFLHPPLSRRLIIWMFIAGIANLYMAFLAVFLLGGTKGKTKRDQSVLVPIAVYAFIRFLFIDSIPRWDGAEYFQALVRGIEGFDFTINSFLKGFNWFGHLTMGYALLTALGQFANPSSLFNLNISNLLLGCLGIYSFYRVCSYFFDSKLENLLLTLLLAINPLFIGVSAAFVPDFGVLVFFLASLAFFLEEKWVMFIFSSIILVFTKETGTFVYGLLGLFYFLCLVLPRWLKTREVKWKKIFILAIPLFAVLLYFQARRWSFWSPDGSNFWEVGESCRFCFGIKPYLIYSNLSVIFILNFNWILSGVILLTTIKSLITFLNKEKGSKKGDEEKLAYEKILSFIFLGFLGLFMVFVVYVMPRYMALSVPLLILLSYFSLRKLVMKDKLRVVFLLFVTLLMSWETFRTIDPISKAVFGVREFGEHKVLTIGSEYLGDAFIYNTEFLYEDRLLSRFFEKFGITTDDNIFMDPYAWGSFKTGWGHFPSRLPNLIYSYSNLNKLPEHLYYVDFPLMQYSDRDKRKLQESYVPTLISKDVVLKTLKEVYKIRRQEKIETNGYTVMAYELVKD